jgi:hypothetical protein
MKAPLRRGVLACGLTVVLALPATAAAVTPQPPMMLPGDAAASAVRAAPSTWIVGARPSAAARALAPRFGARAIGPAGTGGYVVARHRARAFAAALRERGLLFFAEPDRYTSVHQGVPNDPLSAPPNAWRSVVADPALTPPPVTPTSPMIALIDTQMLQAHTEFTGSNTRTLPRFPVASSHGTATASVAAAPVNGRGIVGVWPNARALNIPLPNGDQIPCSASVNGIVDAIRQGAAVINMSYGSAAPCYQEYVAVQFAVKAGVVPVAAAGNEGQDGNPPEFPASLPHVLTAAAVGPDDRAVGFSNANAAIDLAAPGVQIMTAVPPALDEQAPADGYMVQSGTSFSAPMVAAAVAWVRAARPTLSPDQVAQVIRLSARDVGSKGWEPDTGFGVVSIGRALAYKAPARDNLEPNDDIPWVNGDAFGAPNPLTFNGRKRVRLRGLLDKFEDPADVYRIRVRPHRRVKISADPRERSDDVSLKVFRKNAKGLDSRAFRKSAHKGRRTERIVLRNSGRRPKIYYVAVQVQGNRDLDASYTLRVG